jgi:hypothetical protein
MFSDFFENVSVLLKVKKVFLFSKKQKKQANIAPIFVYLLKVDFFAKASILKPKYYQKDVLHFSCVYARINKDILHM